MNKAMAFEVNHGMFINKSCVLLMAIISGKMDVIFNQSEILYKS